MSERPTELYPHRVEVHYIPNNRGVYREVWYAVTSLGGTCAAVSGGIAAVAVDDLEALREALEALPLELDTPVRRAWIEQESDTSERG